MDASKVLGRLAGSKWGVVGLFAGAAVTVATGAVAYDQAGVQGAAAAAVGVCAVGLTGLVAWGLSQIGGGGPPASGAAPAPVGV